MEWPYRESTYRILIIEDDADVRGNIKESLESFMFVGWKVFEEELFEDGLARLKGNGIDLVILDLRLRDASPVDVYENLDRIRAVSKAAVMVISGVIEVTDERKIIQRGADDCMQKPPESPERFARRVIINIERRRRENAARPTVTDVAPKISRSRWYTRRWLWAKIGAALAALTAIIKALKGQG